MVLVWICEPPDQVIQVVRPSGHDDPSDDAPNVWDISRDAKCGGQVNLVDDRYDDAEDE